MATPRRGPSFAGPLTGWTAATITPTTTTAVEVEQNTLSPAAMDSQTRFRNVYNTLKKNTALGGASGATLTPGGRSNLERYNLTDEELGRGGGGGRGAGGGGRGSFTTPTPLESLLASIFPDATFGSDPAPPNPNTAAPQANALFRTILGNLGAEGLGGGGTAATPVYSGPSFGVPAGAGAQIAATIPGAPAFLGGAIDRVNASGSYIPPAVGSSGVGGGLNAAGIAALAAEQRIQANQLAQEQAEANAAYFQQQQEMQRAKALAAQRQRQRFGAPNAITSGWASNPILF